MTARLLVAAAISGTCVIGIGFWYSRKRSCLCGVLACKCGKVRIKVDSDAPMHLVCYCDDCQKYLQWLAKVSGEKDANSHIADVQGGSRTCQVFRGDLQVIQGKDLLKCTASDAALVPPGRWPPQMLRLHSTCCYTAMFSACWRELPTVGFYAANFIKLGQQSPPIECCGRDPITNCWSDAESDRETWLPPPEYRINTKWVQSVTGIDPPKGDATFPVRFLLRFIARNILIPRSGWWGPHPWPLPSANEVEIRRIVL